jgi:hypothetical protein
MTLADMYKVHTESPVKEWRPVKGFPKFQISNHGEVRNKNTGNLVAPYLSEYQGIREACVMLAHRGVERRVFIFDIYTHVF